jgi:poly(3-hydroxybutyrate) depolymerase
MLYQAYQAQADATWATRHWSRTAAPWLLQPPLGRFATHRQLGAACELYNLVEVTHRRPDWGIDEVGGVGVREHTLHATPFATLTRFVREGASPGPKVLLVAPMSGHFATLLRDTVRTMAADHDVHVTDWHNARDVPLSAGRFGFDEYVAHLVDFVERMGPRTHVVAICQPCVAALAAVAVMAEDDHDAQPATLTLMAGPVDCRISPTVVNELANGQPIEWFERHLISRVPWRMRGAGRRVYPGFLQLAAFMSMNRERHAATLREYYLSLVADEAERTLNTRDFYREYFAVADLPAEFYLETVERVFQRCDLSRGELRWRGRRVDPSRIRRTALLTVEGERDDICSVGQTLAAQDLCTGLRPYMRKHVVQAGVGHYGVFSGRRWQQQIYPQVREMIHLFDG